MGLTLRSVCIFMHKLRDQQLKTGSFTHIIPPLSEIAFVLLPGADADSR